MQPVTITSATLESGRVLREPPGSGPGNWVGAPGLFHAMDEGAWYLTYRLRRPRGVQPDRGGEARIARSTDLKLWNDVWSVTKDKFNTASMERCAIHQGPDGLWRYFTSFVDPADGRWCVEVLKASSVAAFDPSKAERLFTATDYGLEGVKDPWVFEKDGVFHMFLSVALPTQKTDAESHSTLDIFNTGECVSATALATSRDLEKWDWQGVVFKPDGRGWDCYCRRLNTVFPLATKLFGFYDGSASEKENYEEKCALATSSDLRDWRSLSVAGSFVKSPFASGSARYFAVEVVGGQAHIFYEFAREDGAHDMRLLTVPATELAF